MITREEARKNLIDFIKRYMGDTDSKDLYEHIDKRIEISSKHGHEDCYIVVTEKYNKCWFDKTLEVLEDYNKLGFKIECIRKESTMYHEDTGFYEITIKW